MEPYHSPLKGMAGTFASGVPAIPPKGKMMTFDTYLIRPQRVLAEQITEPGGRDVMSMGQTIHGNVTDWVIDDGGGFLTVMNNTDFVANYVLRSTIPGL